MGKKNSSRSNYQLTTQTHIRKMNKLKERWGVNSTLDIIMILVVFSVTGSASAWLSAPVMEWLSISKESMSLWVYWPIRIVVLFPIYQVLLVFFGYVFGQFTFFWTFEKKMIRRLGLGFLLNEETEE